MKRLLDMTSQVRMSSIMVRALTEAVQAAGVAPAAFVARCRVDAARMADPYAWFSLEEFDALVATAVEMTEDAAFGLHWGERSPLMQFDLASSLTATAPTLRSAIMAVIRAQPIFLSHPPLTFSEDQNRCICRYNVIASTELGLRIGTELSLAAMLRLVRYYAADAVRRIDIAYARPPYAAEYERLFGPALHFEQMETALELDRLALDRPLLHRNAELHTALVERTEQLRQRALGELSISDRVTQHVRTSLPKVPAMMQVARALELSERSLRRRLAEEGASYSDLVDRVQSDMARELLAAGHKPAKQLAAALGFDSISGFVRASKRWSNGQPLRAKTRAHKAPE